MKMSILATTLLASAIVSQPAAAQESVLENVLTSLVNHALSMTTSEINMDVYESVVVASYHFALDEEAQFGQVSVTDLAMAQNEVNSERSE